MPSLHELQQRFVREVFREDGDGASALIRPNGLPGPRRLQVYRNNMFTSLSAALRAVYPVVERLVGEQFFPYAASEYIRHHPSASGDLHDFGADFASFLNTFEPTAQLIYLPDVAALEWAYHRVFHAAGHSPLDLARLQQVPEQRYGEIKFKPHPASWLLASVYPVLHIWQVNQDDYKGEQTVDLAAGGHKLLVIRRDLDIEIHQLEEGEYALLQALADDHDFASACSQALAVQPDYDVAAGFRQHVVHGTLVDFTI